MNEAANDSGRVSRQGRKKPPALETNQIAGFGGFRPLASLEKINRGYYRAALRYEISLRVLTISPHGHVTFYLLYIKH